MVDHARRESPVFNLRVRVVIFAIAAVAVATVSTVIAPATASAETSCTRSFAYNATHYSGTNYAHLYGWYWSTSGAVYVGQADPKENVTNATGLSERVRVHDGPSNGTILKIYESGGTIDGDAIVFTTHVDRVFFVPDITLCAAVVHQSDQSVVPNTTVCKSLPS
jgi:hypothetical protein